MGLLDVLTDFHSRYFGPSWPLLEEMDPLVVQLCAVCGQYLNQHRPFHLDVGVEVEPLGSCLLWRFPRELR